MHTCAWRHWPVSEVIEGGPVQFIPRRPFTNTEDVLAAQGVVREQQQQQQLLLLPAVDPRAACGTAFRRRSRTWSDEGR